MQGHYILICCRDLAKRSLPKILPTELLQRACTKISKGDLAKRSLHGDLAKRSLPEILPRELLQRACAEISKGDLAKRASTEILPKHLLQRSCQEVSRRDFSKSLYRDCVQGSCQETSHRDLVHRDVGKRTETLLRDPLQSAWTERLLSDHLQRSSVEISIATLCR